MPDEPVPLVSKTVLHTGQKYSPFVEGSKVHFHYRCCCCNEAETFIDDTRKMGAGKPVELILGKKFKLPVWEQVIQTMGIAEVAKFTIDKSLVSQYPFVSKTLRDASDKSSQTRKSSHCCAMTLQTEGVGYEDLNRLMKNPCNLQFTIELLKVEGPEEYRKDAWQLDDQEKLARVKDLKQDGNAKFKEKMYGEAADAYAEAIGLLETLILKEKPNDIEWLELNKQKIPFLLNYSQCKLFQGDFYAVIEHCTTVLQFEPNNVKALFRRAKAHVGAWNPDKAKQDFESALRLDESLDSVVRKELQSLNDQIKSKYKEDNQKFKRLFTS